MADVRVLLQPRVGDRDATRVWVGVLGHPGDLTDADLAFSVDGRTVVARPVRHVSRAIDHDDFVGTQTGVFELPSGAGPHEVRVTADLGPRTVASDVLRTAPVPDALPADNRTTLNVLIASCYYEPQDKGKVGHGIANLPATLKPHLTLLMGDQVYLDNPPTETFPGGRAGVRRRLEQKYLANWALDPGRTSGYARLLSAAPIACVPDDHEYWNNYPMKPAFPGELVSGDDNRRNWATTARTLFEAFQLDAAGSFDRAIDIEPLSIYLMDNRTFRSTDLSHSLQQGALGRFTDWVERVLHEPTTIPVLVTGPSVFQPAKESAWWAFWGRPTSGLSDANLANFDDYRPILQQLLRLSEAGRPVLCLSGDVHYSRVLAARRGVGAHPIHEVICSPTSLVPTPFKRDRSPTTWPSGMQLSVPGANFAIDPLHPDPRNGSGTGDNVAVASFRRTDFGAELRLTYVTFRDSGLPSLSAPVVIPLRRVPR